MAAQTARCHSLSDRCGLALTAFAVWRVDIAHTGGVELSRNSKIAQIKARSSVPMFRII